jgi:tRNA pseudouridine55 synthase
MDGLLIIDKPPGPTSHDVVARMRRVLRERRIGHTGTLDPMATGVLPLVLGRATRLARFLSASDKSYEAVIRLGVSTDTADAEGTLIGPAHVGRMPSREAVDRALNEFRGTFNQQPPAFSAKKIGGERSYNLARAAARLISGGSHLFSTGAGVPPPARTDADASPLTARHGRGRSPDLPALPDPASVTVHRLEIVSVEADHVTLSLDCSAGFYVRSLAHDLGQRLGTGGYLASLRRTRSGGFSLDEAIELGAAERDAQGTAAAVIPLSRMLSGLASIVLTADGVVRATHGRDLRPVDLESGSVDQTGVAGFVRLMDSAGGLVGIAEPASAPGLLHPSVVLM